MKEVNINEGGSPDRPMLRQAKKAIALVCAASVWIAINANVVMAKQNEFSIGADSGQTVSTPNVESGFELLESPTGLALAVASIVAVSLLAFNLVSTGKRGWGWVAICVLGVMIGLAIRLSTAMFCEVSSANSVADWDED